MEEFSSPNWDDVPNYHTDGRSVLEYPDPAPELTAKMWDEHRERRRQARATLAKIEADDDSLEVYQGYEAPVVLSKADEFDEPCSSLAGFVKLAHSNGWSLVELAHAVSSMKGKPYAGGEKEGAFRPDRTTDLQWAKFEKEGIGRILLCFPIVNGKVRSTDVVRSFNGTRYGDNDMRKIMKGTHEREA